jgi:multidrug resistance protein, MATE family
MGSALETLCGQAVGAGQFEMLGVYMQRSWIICLTTALFLTPAYIFTSPILKFLHQSEQISETAGLYTLWTIPQVFAYAFNFPLQKFFQSQSRVWIMTVISGVALGVHALLNWVLVIKLGKGLFGAAMVGNVSWWLINLAQFLYLIGGAFPEAWKGFSWSAFKNLAAFVKLSLASAIMLWSELYMNKVFNFSISFKCLCSG